MTARATRPRPRPPLAWSGHGDLGASLALVFPLFLAYAVGALLVGSVSAVDVSSRALWRACGHDGATYLLVHAALAVAFLVWLHRSGRRSALSLEIAAPVVMEAAIYGLTLAAVIDLVLTRGLGLGGETVVAALGAGLHEELVFRLGALAGGAALLRRGGASPRVAWLVALVASSLVFAAAHHWAGEPWEQRVFTFRVLAGAAFGLIFWNRSLAHAVWAHTIYDLYVALIR